VELTNTFDVSVPVDEAWVVLTDLERIAPCMPGAQLQEVEGDEYRGIVKVKVGPITAQFKGAAHFVERDERAHRAVLRAEGRDTGGKGNAAATITAQLEPHDAGTHVTVATDLHITGKVAQFGRGALADVSSKLLKQFVEQLEATVLAGTPSAPSSSATAATGTAPAAPAATAAAPAAPLQPEPAPAMSAAAAAREPEPEPEGRDTPTVRTIDSPEPAPVDLVGTAGAPLLKRAAPVLAAVAGLVLLRRFRRRRARRRAA
jgi:carbon monoxide dehydrogenase subunit G